MEILFRQLVHIFNNAHLRIGHAQKAGEPMHRVCRLARRGCAIEDLRAVHLAVLIVATSKILATDATYEQIQKAGQRARFLQVAVTFAHAIVVEGREGVVGTRDLVKWVQAVVDLA